MAVFIVPFPNKIANMTFITTSTSPFLATDGSVGIVHAPTECTVAQAARFLDMSEACLDGLLVLGAIKYREEGGQRLIQHGDLLEYEQDRKRMHTGLVKIVRLSEEMGLYDD